MNTKQNEKLLAIFELRQGGFPKFYEHCEQYSAGHLTADFCNRVSGDNVTVETVADIKHAYKQDIEAWSPQLIDFIRELPDDHVIEYEGSLTETEFNDLGREQDLTRYTHDMCAYYIDEYEEEDNDEE